MKRDNTYFVFCIFVFFFLSSIFSLVVSAAPSDYVGRDLFEGARPVLELILGSIDTALGVGAGELLLIKFLVFLLLIAVTNYSISQIPTFKKNKSVRIILALIVSFIAIRYITQGELVRFIWLPYGVYGVAMAALLPFVIFFFFIESFDEHFIREFGWLVMAVIYLGLAYFRWGDFAVGGEWYENLAWIYVAIAVISILALSFDKPLHVRMLMARLKKEGEGDLILLESELKKDLKKYNDVLANPDISEDKKAEIKRKMENVRRSLVHLRS